MTRLEHIGIAVEEVDAVIDCFDDLLELRPYKTETVSQQAVRTHFLDAETAKLELLEALEPDSPVARYLDRHGEGLHHLAFEVENIEATMERLRAAGFELLSDQPQSGADDKRIFFVHPKQTHGVLVEFCETTAPSWTPTRVPHRNGHLAIYERGDSTNPSVLLLHGAAGSTLLDTAPLMRRLESSFHLIGLDLCGHGASSFPPDGRLSLDRFVDDVRTALTAVDRSSAHVFGFSMGGAVALRLAQTDPDRVDRLALLATPVQWTEALVDAMKERLDLEALQSQHPKRAERLFEMHEGPTRLYKALNEFVETLPSHPAATVDALSSIPHSTLVTLLDEDPLFPLEVTQNVYRHLPHARLAVLPGTRHALRDLPLDLLTPLLRRHFLQE